MGKVLVLVSAVMALVQGLTLEERTGHVSDMLAAIEDQVDGNPLFLELKAATLQAVAATQEDGTDTLVEVGRVRRSPMQEIAALTDQMLIQNEHETNALVLTHTKYQKACKKNQKAQADIISAKRLVETNSLETAMNHRRHWEGLLPELPLRDRLMAQTQAKIVKSNDELQDAVDNRAKDHAKFLDVIRQHDEALADVAKIRKIIQNSNLDGRSNKNARVSAGGKSTKHHIKSLLEIKGTCHPSLHNLIELSHQAVSSGKTEAQMLESGAVDRIYRLIYKTRDALLLSKDKAIKNEAAKNSAWRTNKIAFRNDINDLEILKVTYYMQKGILKRNIGNSKKLEGEDKIRMAKAVKIKEDNQIRRNFLVVACDEEQVVSSRNLATKQNEKRALQLVQKKLVSLKWSNKVYASIGTVTQGVTHFRGKYNFHSALGRYVAVSGKRITCGRDKHTGPDAATFELILNKDDLSYLIEHRNKAGHKRYLMQDEDTNDVVFSNRQGKSARWNFKFDDKTNSFFITNQKSKMFLNVDPKKNYLVSTHRQTVDAKSRFTVERSDYQEEACYKNKIGKQLEYYGGAHADLNTDKCLAICKDSMTKTGKKYTHFGLSEGKQCFCGTTWDKEKAPSTDCGKICPGHNGEICGGEFRTLIFRLTPDPKPIIS